MAMTRGRWTLGAYFAMLCRSVCIWGVFEVRGSLKIVPTEYIPSHVGMQLSVSIWRLNPPLQPLSHDELPPLGCTENFLASRRHASMAPEAVGRKMYSGLDWMMRLNWAEQSLAVAEIST